jgi:uncharacterized repeat protein (TIGR01451 family)
LIAIWATAGQAQFGAFNVVAETLHDIPQMVKCADLDGDADLDILVCSSGDDQVSWHRNEGDGVFSVPMLIGNFPEAKYIEPTDLDGDGDLDIVVGGGAFLSEHNVGWIECLGGGLYATPQMITSTYGRGMVLVSDVDADGDKDVIAGRAGMTADALSVFLNVGNGSFIQGTTFGQMVLTVGDMRSADLDGDGDLDMVMEDLWVNAVMRYDNLGDGTFGSPTMMVQTESLSGGVAISDVNGDAYPDVSSIQGDSVVWLLNDGNGGFPEQLSTYIGPAFTQVWTADLDLDGDQDMFISGGPGSNENCRVLFGQGNGSFTPTFLVASYSDGLFRLSYMDAGDLNGDGIPDLVISSGTFRAVECYFHDGNGGFVSPDRLGSSPGGGDVAHIDMNGDGLKDWVSVADFRTTWRPALPGGGWGYMQVFRGLSEGDGGAHCFIDVDGDEDPDLAFSGNNSPVVAVNPGNGIHASGVFLNTTATLLPLVAIVPVDVDEDGDLDVVTGESDFSRLYWLENPGSGPPFIRHDIATNVPKVTDLCSADIDSDGIPDLVHLAHSNDKLVWYQNDGTGSFSSPILVGNGVTGFRKLVAADLNNDGHQDLIASGYNGFRWYLNDGAGSFGEQYYLPQFSDATEKMHATDMNGDGYPDLLFAANGTAGLGVLLNNGTGSAFELITLATGGPVYGVNTSDMDEDGDPDILVGGEPSGWFENLAPHEFRAQGHVYADLNANGTRDAGEPPFPYMVLDVEPQDGFIATLEDGSYTYDTHQPNVQISATATWPGWAVASVPAIHNVTFTEQQPIVTGLDLGLVPTLDTISIAAAGSWSPVVCSQSAQGSFYLLNMGSALEQVRLTVTLDPLTTFLDASPPPTTVNGDTLTWELPDLGLLATQQVSISVQLPGFEAMGQPISFNSFVTATNGAGLEHVQQLPVWTEPLTCAYDPNDKRVSPAGYGVAGAVPVETEELQYTIRFQNTGTAPATDVYLVDQIDPALDPATLRITGTSHPLTAISIDELGEVIFRFDDIMLPDSSADLAGSQGYVSFLIRLRPGATHGDVISNTVGIHFDLNPAIITNTTQTTLVDCSLHRAELLDVGNGALAANNGAIYQWFRNGEAITNGQEPFFWPLENGSYTVQVTSDFGCTDTSEAYVLLSVGLGEQAGALRAVVVPNPSSAPPSLLFSELLPIDAFVDVYDAQGRHCDRVRSNGTQKLALSNEMEPGFYLIRVSHRGLLLCTLRMVRT